MINISSNCVYEIIKEYIFTKKINKRWIRRINFQNFLLNKANIMINNNQRIQNILVNKSLNMNQNFLFFKF